MPKPLRRLELRLPANHPVWSLPEGSRSKIVREWLDVGRRLYEIEDSLRLVAGKLNHDTSENNGAAVPKTKIVNHHESQNFDKKTFLSHFE